MDDFVFKAENQFSQKGRSRLCEIAKGVFILAFLVFITVCGAQAWADDYYWIGVGVVNDWNDVDNWSTDDPTTATPPFASVTTAPGSGDTAIFNTAGTYSFTQNITVDNLNSNAALEFSGTVEIGAYSGSGNITNNGALTINSANNFTIPTITNNGTFQNNSTGNVTVTALTNNTGGTIENAGGGTLTITTLTMTADTTVTNSDGATTIGTLGGAFEATLNNDGGTEILVGGYGAAEPTIIANKGTIKLKTGKIAELTVNNSTTVIWGDLETTSNVKLTNTSNSVLQSNGSGSATLVVGGDLEISGAIGYSTGDNKKFGSVKVTGTTTINAEDATHKPCLKTTGAVTLNTLVNDGSMEVGGALTVNGTTTNNTAGKITVSGNQTYKDDITNAGAINVNAGITFTAEKNTTNSGAINVVDSTSSPAAATIKFDGDFTNTGTYSADGSTITFGGNVDNSTGTFTDGDAIITATGASATINGGANGIKAASFTCNGDVTFSGANEYGALTTAATGSVKLGAEDVVVTGTLENNGTIIYTADGRITNSSGTPRNDTLRGTVRYNGSTTLTDFADDAGYPDYFNLIIDNGISLTGIASSDIVVSNNLEVNSQISGINSITDGINATTEINANITTTGVQDYRGVVTIADGVTLAGSNITFGTAINDNDVTINGTANINANKIKFVNDVTITAGITTFNATEVKAKDIKITGNGAITLDGGTSGIEAETLTYAPSTPSGASFEIKGDNTFKEFTAANVGGATLNVNGTQTITTKLALTGTSDTDVLTVTGSSGKFVISAEQSGRYLKIFYGNVAMNNATGVSPAVYFVATDSVYNNGTTGVQDRWRILSNKIIWTGASVANPTDWHDPANWDAGTVPGLSQAQNAAISGSFAVDTTSCDVEIPSVSTDYPNASAHAYTIRTLKISAAAASLELSSANNITITDTTSPLENAGTIIYSGEGRLTDGTDPINDATQGTVQYSAGASTLSGVNYYDLIIDSGLTLTSNGDIKIANSMVVGTAATPAAAELTFAGNLTIASTASYTADTSKLTFEKDFTNTGTFTDAAAEITATGTTANIAGGGTATIPGIKANKFTYSPTTSSGAKLKITGYNEFTDFTADGLGGAEITIEDEQNITGDLILTGSSKATHLNIKGNGNIVIATEQGNGKYLTVDQTDIKINNATTGAPCYYATDSEFDTGIPPDNKKYGIHNNWNLITEGTVFIWTGGANDQNWNTPENWDANMIPGLAAGLTGGPIVDTRYYDIVIPNNDPTGTALGTNYPVIGATFADDYIVQKLQIESDASVQLNSANNIVLFKDPFSTSTSSTSELENFGTIIYSNTGRIGNGKDGTTTTPAVFDVPTNDVTPAHNGTVEYRGSVTLTDFDTRTGDYDDYYNLVIYDSANVTGATGCNIVIAGKFTIKAGAKVTAEKIGIKGDVVETGAATIKGDVYFCGANSSTVIEFGDGTGSYTIDGNLHLTSAATKTLGSSITATNVILYEGTVNVNAALKTTGDLILFGNDYHIIDSLDSVAAANSNASDLFKYHHAGRGSATHAQPSYKYSATENFPSNRPDGESINSENTSCTGKMEVADTITITVGKNFYANGTSITSATGTSWTLAIPNSDNQKTAFAELYKSTIENCKVTGGVVAAVEGNTVTDCENIETLRPLIAQAYTVYDDVIYISFGYDKDGDGKVDLNPDGTPTHPAKVENTNNEINAAIAKGVESISHGNGGNVAFAGAFTDATCQTSTNGKGDLNAFYIKADSANKWNTDATGVWHGTDDSTDRGGTHSIAVPYINLRKAHKDATDYIYETLRDSHKNRIAQYYTASPAENGSLATPATPANTVIGMSSDSGKAYTMVEDHASPVLIAAFTGQEQHTLSDNPALDQKDYDAHNFIEFRYSEPLLFEDTEATPNDIFDGTATPPNYTNIRADATWGHVSGSGSLTVAGIATITSGSISAGLRGSDSEAVATDSPHALYIDFPVEAATDTTSTINVENKETKCRVRVSIAGYVDGTVEVDGSSHKVFVRKNNKNWIGYINSAATTMPSGTVTPVTGCRITDRAVTAGSTNASATLLKNALDKDSTANHTIATVTMNAKVDATTTGLYKTWDLTPPAFAPLRINGKPWRSSYNSIEDSSEVIGFGAGTYLQVLEIHMFDNQPSYASSESPQWFSRVGWAERNSDDTYGAVKSDTADIIGGSRTMVDKPDNEPYKTRGGIRSCTLVGEHTNFKYTTTIGSTSDSFTNASSGASSNFFTSIIDETLTKPIEYYDSNYFNITLGDDRLTADAMFTVTFDSNSSYITDLAGNRFRPQGTITLKGLDRTPPSFSLTAVPLGTNKMLIVFADAVNLGNMQLYRNATDSDSVSALEYIPKGLILTASSSNIEIDDTVPAQVVFQNGRSTAIIITLKQDAILNDITEDVYVEVVASTDYTYDPLTGTNGEVTYIQDSEGNFIKNKTQHALSDFAINAVQMQYAYSVVDPEADGEDFRFDVHAMNQSSFSAREWDEEKLVTSSVKVGKEIIMQAALYDGTTDNTGGISGQNFIVHFDHSPDPVSVSTTFNSLTDKNWRVWLPELFKSIAPVPNDPEHSISGSPAVEISTPLDPADRLFMTMDIDQADAEALWHDGDQVKFLFELENCKVRHGGSSDTAVPLYCLRLKNPADITSLDLWSIRTRSAILQRGGVTILNNVINVNASEKATVQINKPTTKDIKVMVMTLDGNIVRYLQPYEFAEGIHYYVWDGKNKGGTPVARGLYFVRVIGQGIDETRKIMVVKD